MTISTSRVVCIAAALAAVPLTSSADLLSYEPFSYPTAANGLAGQTGGFNFSGPWTLSSGETNAPNTTATSLTYTDSNGVALPTCTGAVLVDSTNATAGNPPGDTVAAFRSITGGISGASGTTLYLSFLAQQTAGTNRFINLALYGTALQEIIAVGTGESFGGQNWGAYHDGNSGKGAYSATPSTTLSLLVLRIDLNVAGTPGNMINDRFRLYENPTLGLEPVTAAVDVSDFDLMPDFSAIAQIRIAAGNSTEVLPASQMLIDEIRLADSYAAAAPIPEPSTAALLTGALALFSLRRTRRSPSIG